jgi:hypothetical protein
MDFSHPVLNKSFLFSDGIVIVAQRAELMKSKRLEKAEPGFLHEVPQELPGAHVECRRIADQVRTWFG